MNDLLVSGAKWRRFTHSGILRAQVTSLGRTEPDVTRPVRPYGSLRPRFWRVYLEPVPDDTSLRRWANRLGPETLAGLNALVVELARSLKATRGRKLRVDGMVVETTPCTTRPPAASAALGCRC